MKKILIIFFVLIFNCAFAQDTVKVGVKYNEARAKIEAFKDVQRKIEKDFFRDYLKDINYEENLELIEKKVYLLEGKRSICPFYLRKSLLSYAIVYLNEPDRVYYYNVLGNLVKFDIIENKTYPRRTFGYSRYGNLVSVAFEVDGDEQFIYDKKGNLIAHWSGSNMVDEKTRFFKITRITKE